MARETRQENDMDAADQAEVFLAKSHLYESQFFGFTPQTCMLRVYSAFQDCLCEMLEVVEKVCVRQLKNNEADEEQLRTRARECSRRLQRFMDARFKQLAERMETLLIEPCFTVPANVLLPEDQQHHKHPADLQEVLRVESSIAELHRAYEAEVCARQALRAELEEQKEVQQQLDGILAWVRELQAAWSKEGLGSFHDSFKTAMESVKKLQSAIAEVCNKNV